MRKLLSIVFATSILLCGCSNSTPANAPVSETTESVVETTVEETTSATTSIATTVETVVLLPQLEKYQGTWDYIGNTPEWKTTIVFAGNDIYQIDDIYDSNSAVKSHDVLVEPVKYKIAGDDIVINSDIVPTIEDDVLMLGKGKYSYTSSSIAVPNKKSIIVVKPSETTTLPIETSETVELSMGDGGSIICAISEEYYDEFIAYATNSNIDEINKMLDIGVIFRVPDKTTAVVKSQVSAGKTEVKIIGGSHDGETVIVAADAIYS